MATTSDNARARYAAGRLTALATGVFLLAIAVSVDFPRASLGFKGDEATYYGLAKSLARDGDFTYTRQDLVRVWEEYSAPEGIFLKRGRTVRLDVGGPFPFVHWRSAPDPDPTRLYFGKAYIYPLAAAPFVWLFGTNGFLVLHALLLALDVWLAYAWLVARGSSPRAAATFAVVFLFGSVVPVYFVWLTPEVFNFSLALMAVFLWSVKAAGEPAPAGFLGSRRSDYLAALLAGVVTFSKPTNAVLIVPMVLFAVWRRRWAHALAMGTVFTLTTAGLFGVNAAVTGEFNYQGGERKTFYSVTGFPFANERETFDSIGSIHGRSEALVDTLVSENTLPVMWRNLGYFAFGRHSGLVPYFFPGVLALGAFLVRRRAQRAWQWMLVGALAFGMFALLFITPYTWAGGGGSIGNRYFISFYPLFLFLTPPLAGVRPALVALAVGALFTAKLVFNPFWTSFNPGEHAKAGPLRLLPIELTMLNDLPVAAKPDRIKRVLNGGVLAYFPDDNAYGLEGAAFWVRGRRRADVILRGPLAERSDGQLVGRRIARITVRVQNGLRTNTVTIDTGRDDRSLQLGPHELQTVTLDMAAGLPYRPYDTPTSYVYVLSIRTRAGFVPFLETPPSSDARFLGAMITITPEFQ